MNILLLNPPHTAIGSRVPREHLPPFGLLCVGGPLLDLGYGVELLNADMLGLDVPSIVQRVGQTPYDAILVGHSGSSSAHPTIVEIVRGIRVNLPETKIIYGGVYPTYHWQDVLAECPEIDVIVRGEGEETAPRVISALAQGQDLSGVPGIAFHGPRGPQSTRPANMVSDLDQTRIGWELIDFDDYSYWGGKKAVILQFSRGCPHLCTYCGQRGFWTKWRHRDPVKLAREIAFLYHQHGVELVNFADENPTSSRRQWKAFLEAMIAENVPVTLIGSTRAGDIVRDADILPLYKQAGVLRFLLGIEATNDAALGVIKKGSDTSTDQQAINLLRAHGMIGLCTFAVGFEDGRDKDYWAILRQLLRYDPDQIMSVYATPHRWTPYFNEAKHRKVIQEDLRLWDYKHQVLNTDHVPAWRVFLWVKFIEMVLQLRPKALWRTYMHSDPDILHAMQWYTRMGRRVVWREIFRFVFSERRRAGQTVAAFWGGDEQLPELAHTTARKRSAEYPTPGP